MALFILFSLKLTSGKGTLLVFFPLTQPKFLGIILLDGSCRLRQALTAEHSGSGCTELSSAVPFEEFTLPGPKLFWISYPQLERVTNFKQRSCLQVGPPSPTWPPLHSPEGPSLCAPARRLPGRGGGPGSGRCSRGGSAL